MENVGDHWEVRPNGMLVQLRACEDSQHRDDLSALPRVTISVAQGSLSYHICLHPNSTFGEVKTAIEKKTGLGCEFQKILFRGVEKEDGEYLQESGVRDKSKIVLLENPSNTKKSVVEEATKESGDIKWDNMKKEAGSSEEMSKALIAVDQVREEIDILGDRVAALQITIDGGTKVADEEFAMSAELLMRQLLRLDAIEAEGEAKLQRKAEVLRIQKFHEMLDDLKGKQSNPFIDYNNSASLSSSVRNADDWETFG